MTSKLYTFSQGEQYFDGHSLSQGANGNRHVTPPGSGHKMKPTPEGSHVSSILGRKAHNGSMDIYYRKAHNGSMDIYYRKAQMA
jgi:hypothetical protein